MEDVTNMHGSKANEIKKKLFFTGSTAVSRGYGLVYAFATVTTATGETATDAWGQRDKCVALPTTAGTGQLFAGVTAADYPAVVGGQWIDVYLPGSSCEVFTLINTTVGATALVVSAVTGQEGKFIAPVAEVGRGTALALQTVTAGAGALVFARINDGAESGLKPTA